MTNTKALFIGLLKTAKCDLVLDVGSRDGTQSLLLQDVCPEARVVAFEPNPENFQRMGTRKDLSGRGIEILPYAVCDTDGPVHFHLAGGAANTNAGMSSLFRHPDIDSQFGTVVEGVRLDSWLRDSPSFNCRSIGLWLDVEGAEYQAVAGMGSFLDRVAAAHIEAAVKPIRTGQKSLAELDLLLSAHGLVPVGSDIKSSVGWGNVVYCNRRIMAVAPWPLRLIRLKAWIANSLRVDEIAAMLRTGFPRVYRLGRRLLIDSM